MSDTPLWRIGFGSVCITPQEPSLLAGYSGNGRMHESVSRDIYVRTLYISHADGTDTLLLGLDLCGVDETTVDGIRAAAATRWGLPPEQVVINSTHNHSAPNVDTTLSLYYEHTPALDAQIAAYTAQVRQAAQDAIAAAHAAREPATLHWSQSLAGFAVNRRRSRPGCRHLPGPVDPDVPVLAARRPDGTLIGAAFAYACHTTSLCGKDLNGDYAGYACAWLEEQHPDATFLFLAGCGANQNPLPRYRAELSRAYGMILGQAVDEALRGRSSELTTAPRASRTELALPIVASTAEQLATLAATHSPANVPGRSFRILCEQAAQGTLPTSVPYTLQALRFGTELALVAYGGETIVEYALHAKARLGWETTMALGYCDALTPYIPTAAVLDEGGYEADALYEYGYPGRLHPDTEALIHAALESLIE